MTRKKASGGDVRGTSRRKPSPAQALAKEDDVVLVPVDEQHPDVFLLFSCDRLDLGEYVGGPLPDAATQDVIQNLGSAAGLGNIGLQGLNGLQACQGLVRLAPETLALLSEGATPLTVGGYNLGTLTSGGRFVAQVRWLPATGATAVGVMAAIGPAVVMAAMQLQLAAISRKLDRIAATTSEILRASRREKWATVWGEMDMLRRALEETRELGQVNDNVFAEARGAYRTLNASRHQLRADVEDHRRALTASMGAATRRDWLLDHLDVVLQDAQCLVLASVGCLVYEELRAEHAELTDPEHARVIRQRAVDEARRERASLTDTLTTLDRALRMLAAHPGRKRIHFLGLDRAPDQVADAADQMSKVVADLAGVLVERPLISGVVVYGTGGPLTQDDEPIATLRWHLAPGERLLEVWTGKSGVLAATDRRLFYAKSDRLAVEGWSADWDRLGAATVVEDWGDWNIQVIDGTGKKRRLEVAGQATAAKMAERVEARRQQARSAPRDNQVAKRPS